MEQTKQKSRKWMRWVGLAGLAVVLYQSLNIGLALFKEFSGALLLYTFEVILMVLLVQIVGKSFYYWLIKEEYPSGYQTLCMNCQMIKKFGNDEWYHGEPIDLSKRLVGR